MYIFWISNSRIICPPKCDLFYFSMCLVVVAFSLLTQCFVFTITSIISIWSNLYTGHRFGFFLEILALSVSNQEVQRGLGEVYSIPHYVIKFVSMLRQVRGFLWVLRFPPSIKLTVTIYKCNWNSIGSGAKYHNPLPMTFLIKFFLSTINGITTIRMCLEIL